MDSSTTTLWTGLFQYSRVSGKFFLFVCVHVFWPSQPNGVMQSEVSVVPNHTFTGQSSNGLTSTVHILSPETENCPSWISWGERMTKENISWSTSIKECCWPGRVEPTTSWSPVRRAFNWYFIEIPIFNANSVDPDQMSCSPESNLHLHCL